MKALLPSNEASRLEALRQYDVLDTAPEQEFDDLTHLAAQICGTPISVITLLDQERQWFKSAVGLDISETPRDVSFCAHAILGDELLLVPDATADERFADNPFVTSEPHLRFYAGVPLVTPEGQAVGSLCVLDTVPRHLDQTQQDALRRLGRQAVALLEARPDVTQEGQSRQARHESERQRLMLAAATARQDADDLKASEMRYQRLFEAAKDGILILDAATGEIEDVNPFLCHLLGYEEDDFVGKQLWEIGTFRDIAANQDAFRRLQERDYMRYDDLPLETKDGHSVSVEFVSNVYLCVDKNVVQCNIRDISERKQAAAAERELQRFLQSTLDALGAHIAVLDENGKIIAVNQAWRQFAEENDGTAASCGVGANYIEVCDAAGGAWAEEAPALARGIRAVMADQQQVFCLEYPCHSPKEKRWFNVCVTRFDGEGPLRLVVAHDNITERKQAEDLIRSSEANLAVAQQIAHLGSWELDLPNLDDININPLRWSDEVFRIFGYQPGQIEVSNENFFRAAHPDDQAAITNAMRESVQDGKPYSIEHRIILPDGRERFVHEQSDTVFDESGKPLKMVGTVQDITERKAASEAMTRLAAIVESSADAIISHALDGIITSWNTGAQALYGYSSAEAMSCSISMLVAPDRSDEELRLFAALLQGERVVNHEMVRVCKDGRHLDVSLTLSPVKNEAGEIIGASAISRDISERKQAENALRASEDRFQSIVTNVPGTVYQFVYQPDGSVEIPFASEGCRKLYEMTPEELQQHPTFPREVIHPEDVAECDRSVAESAALLTTWNWEGRIKLPSGQAKWVQAVAHPRRLPNGGTLWDGLMLDITPRKQAEAERDRFFTMSLDMLAIIGSDGYMKRLNPAFETTLGFSNAELMAVPFLEFVHPDDRAATMAGMAKLESGAKALLFENRFRCRDGSHKWLRWMCAPFEDLWYCVAHDITGAKQSAAALQKAKDELELRVERRTAELARTNAALQVQIAEREGAEAETRARARQQEAVAGLGHQALMDVDMDALLNAATRLVTATLNVELSTVLEVLPGADTLRIRAATGWKTDGIGELVPGGASSQAGYALLLNTPTIVPDLHAETRFKPAPRLLEQGIISGVTIIVGSQEKPFGTLGAHTTQQRHFTQDDVYFLQAMSNVLAAALERHRIETEIRQLNAQLKATNEQLRVENAERQMALGTLQEVTVGLEQAKEEAEQARENAEVANRAKSEFLSRMSHELRTPLNAILGFGQILEKEDLDPLAKESVDYILKGGRHLLGLINEVLDIARVEAGHLEVSLEPVALDDVVPEACALMRSLAAERNIRLDENTSEIGQNHVFADRQRLKQVLINLLANAIKYNRQGGHVEVSCDSKPDGWTSLAIRDTGLGISPEDLPKLFTPFERLGASSSEVEGTGLGLVLSQRLVTAMDGTLTVQSTVGQGTTFTLELRQAASPEEQLVSLAQDAHRPDTIKEGQAFFSVLCIEDNPAHVRLLEVIFHDRPEITLLTAMQGSIGLELARQHEPDMILLDLNLPDINGREVLARLQQSALTRDIPVVIISADATPHQVERLMAAGAKACLTKPLDVDRFLRTLDLFFQAPSNAAQLHAQLNDEEAV